MFPYNHITIIVEGVDVTAMVPAPEVQVITDDVDPEAAPAQTKNTGRRKKEKVDPQPPAGGKSENIDPPAGSSESGGLDLDAMLKEAREAMTS